MGLYPLPRVVPSLPLRTSSKQYLNPKLFVCSNEAYSFLSEHLRDPVLDLHLLTHNLYTTVPDLRKIKVLSLPVMLI